MTTITFGKKDLIGVYANNDGKTTRQVYYKIVATKHSKNRSVCNSISTLIYALGDYLQREFNLDIMKIDKANTSIEINMSGKEFFQQIKLNDYDEMMLKAQDVLKFIVETAKSLQKNFPDDIEVVEEVV